MNVANEEHRENRHFSFYQTSKQETIYISRIFQKYAAIRVKFIAIYCNEILICQKLLNRNVYRESTCALNVVIAWELYCVYICLLVRV